jgi:hypothetical protein
MGGAVLLSVWGDLRRSGHAGTAHVVVDAGLVGVRVANGTTLGNTTCEYLLTARG